MATFFSEHNLRVHFNAPQFTRTRHRFRGPRESEKVNLEINQLYYSFRKLHERYDTFQETFVDRANAIFEGVPTDIEFNDEGTVDISGLEELVHRIAMLKRRVEALEA